MATRYCYPVDLHKESEGGYSVTSPDFDEAFTDGDTLAEAVAEAGDCLEEALAGRIARREDIPAPSPAKGRPTAVPGAVLAAKAALYEALREERLSNSAKSQGDCRAAVLAAPGPGRRSGSASGECGVCATGLGTNDHGII